MIRPLRTRHRRMTGVLAVVLPIGLALAIMARPDELEAGVGVMESGLTSASVPTTEAMARVFVRDFGPWGELPLDALLGRGADGLTLVEFAPTAPLLEPDLLAYWSPAPVGGSGKPELSHEAVLLGRLTETPVRFVIPSTPGHLILFDLARGQVRATRPVPELVER